MPESVASWLFHRAAAGLELDRVASPRLRRLLLAGLDPEAGPLGMVQSLNIFLLLKYTYPLGRAGRRGVAVWARPGPAAAGGDALQVGAAFLPPPEAPEARAYVTWGPPYTSLDGEFRPTFSPLERFAKFYDGLDHVAECESALLGAVAGGRLALELHPFPADDGQLAAAADELRLAVRLTVAYLIALAQLGRFGFPTHLGRGQSLPQLLGPWAEAWMARTADYFTAHAPLRITMLESPDLKGRAVGCKLVPLTLHEAASPGDPSFPAWRELRVAELCSDLVINMAAPGFPLLAAWTFLRGSGEALFANAEMHSRFREAAAGDRAMGHLLQARRGLLGVARARGLDRMLLRAAREAEGSLVMADTALLQVSELVGPTLENAAAAGTRVGDAARAHLAEPAQQQALIFGLCFSAHALHLRGVIHGDLHTNNMALRPEPVAPGARDAFLLGLAGDAYLVPRAPMRACVIDFSRAVLREDSEACAGIGHRQLFREQLEQGLQALARQYAPRFDGDLGRALRDNPAGGFAVLAAADFVAIGRNVGQLLGRDFPALGELCRAVEQAGQQHLADGLLALAAGTAAGVPLPGPGVLRAAFGGLRAAAWPRSAPPPTLHGVFRADAPLPFSSQDPARFPPHADPYLVAERWGASPTLVTSNEDPAGPRRAWDEPPAGADAAHRARLMPEELN